MRKSKNQSNQQAHNPTASRASFRTVKGAPISVMMALLTTRRFMTRSELLEATGYSIGSISHATRLLTGLGWIVARSGKGPWKIAPGSEIIPNVVSGVNMKNPTVQSPPPSPPPIEESDEVLGGEEEEKVQKVVFSSLHRMLLDCGISEPSASQLARLPHINPDYITAHVQAAKDSPFGLGMAVYRMRYNWPAPVVRRQMTRQEDQRKKMRRFLAGE